MTNIENNGDIFIHRAESNRNKFNLIYRETEMHL